MTIRHLLLDLEGGRWANDPEGALEFLAQQYIEVGPFSALEVEVEDLRSEARILERDLNSAETEIEGLKDENDNLFEQIDRLEKKLKEAGIEF